MYVNLFNFHHFFKPKNSTTNMLTLKPMYKTVSGKFKSLDALYASPEIIFDQMYGRSWEKISKIKKKAKKVDI